MNRRSFINLVSSMGAASLTPSLKSMPIFHSVREPNASFSFGIIADPHASESVREGLEHCGDGKTKFLRCIEVMNHLPKDERPDFILVLGDLHFFAIEDELDRIDIPLYPIAGNHESVAQKKQLRALFPGTFQINGLESDYYSFEHKGIHFIGICNAISSDHIGHLCTDQIIPRGQCEWLEEQLAKNDLPKIIFGHIPIEPQGQDERMFLSRNDSVYLRGLVSKYNIHAMYFGHQHLETRQFNVHDCIVTVCRSCCWNFHNAPIGFGLVHVSSGGIVLKEIATGRYTA